MFVINRSPSPGDLRGFGRAMALGFGGLGMLAWLNAWRSGEGASVFAWSGSGWQVGALGLWGIGLGLFGLSRFSQRLTRLVYLGWMSLTIPIGVAMSTVLLTGLYIGLLPVFALIVRLGDPMQRRWGGTTYWKDYKPHEPTLERMKRPF
jgi:hypothetical protein